MEKSCEKCGTELTDGVCPKCIQNDTRSESRKEKFKNFFMPPDKKLVVALG